MTPVDASFGMAMGGKGDRGAGTSSMSGTVASPAEDGIDSSAVGEEERLTPPNLPYFNSSRKVERVAAKARACAERASGDKST